MNGRGFNSAAPRVGINPTAVRPASVDRLEWTPESVVAACLEPRTGHLDQRPVARGQYSTLHRATDRSGRPAWVRRSAPHLIEAYATGHATIHDLTIGAVVPALSNVDGNDLWIERLPWDASSTPSLSSVDRYVTTAVTAPIRDGVIVATGEPHVLDGGGIVVEDVVLAACLEPDQTALLGEVLNALVHGEPVAVVSSVAELCQSRSQGLSDAARRSCLSLRAEWTPAAFGLALHHVTAAAARAGPRAETLVLYADEILHRLDFAHRYRISVPSLCYQQAAWILPSCGMSLR